MKPKVFFKTFGCRTNMFDSQVMMSRLKDYEITLEESEADVIVVNSCTVTNGADSSVRGYINQVERSGRARLYLTGCGAHTKGETLFADKKIFGVFGQSEKEKINLLLGASERFYDLGDLNHVDETIVSDFAGKSRAFIKIQEGCNFRCSYCIIPFVRGDARSMDEERILEQVRILAGNGYGEFVLTGTNVGSYGQGEGRSLAALLRKMSLIRGVRRIRIGSMEPIQVTEAFKELLDEPWLERHLHIALQHTSPTMLRLMNRRNRFESDLKLFEELAGRGYALGTDFIVGHPGESEAVWEEAMANLRRLPLTHVHAFTYSRRDGTPSATMTPEVPGNVSKRRMRELEALVAANNFAFRNAHRVPLEVLVESCDGESCSGLDQFFNKVILNGSEDRSGEWVTVDNYQIEEEGTYVEL